MGRTRHCISKLCGECAGIAELVHDGATLTRIAEFLNEQHGVSASLPTIKTYIYENYDRERLDSLKEVVGTLHAAHSGRSDVCCVVRDALDGLGYKITLSSVRAYLSEYFKERKCDA